MPESNPNVFYNKPADYSLISKVELHGPLDLACTHLASAVQPADQREGCGPAGIIHVQGDPAAWP